MFVFTLGVTYFATLHIEKRFLKNLGQHKFLRLSHVPHFYSTLIDSTEANEASMNCRWRRDNRSKRAVCLAHAHLVAVGGTSNAALLQLAPS